MTEDDLRELLAGIQKQPNGKIRALASKYIPGIPKGPFSYSGTRKDDPNDIVPHQHRRELRGLRVIAAWLNHTDTKSGNSFDSYVTDNGRSYIRHYLIDFGSTLGSAAHGPHANYSGHENEIDPHALLLNSATLGLYVRPYERLDDGPYASVGLYESDLFSPGDFKFNSPNPAFENCTNRDGFWGAKIVMSFTDEQIETAVAQGQLSNPLAAASLVEALEKRRDKTGRYWFSKVNPLDKFNIVNNENRKPLLSFIDLAVEGGLEPENKSVYLYDISTEDGDHIYSGNANEVDGIALPDLEDLNLQNRSESESRLLIITIRTRRESSNKLSKWVKVYIVNDAVSGKFELLGISRQE
jgi:hypothetical protein